MWLASYFDALLTWPMMLWPRSPSTVAVSDSIMAGFAPFPSVVAGPGCSASWLVWLGRTGMQLVALQFALCSLLLSSGPRCCTRRRAMQRDCRRARRRNGSGMFLAGFAVFDASDAVFLCLSAGLRCQASCSSWKWPRLSSAVRARSDLLRGARPGILAEPAPCGAPRGTASQPLACRYWLGRRERPSTVVCSLSSSSSRCRRWTLWRRRRRR